MAAEEITGLILAGGAGRRMGGADKGLVEYQGRPLVAHVIERLAPQVDHLLISANRNREVYAAFGYPVLADSLNDAPCQFEGPLAGLAAGLQASTTPWLLCVPCDCPALPLDLAKRLHGAAISSNAALAVVRNESGVQPTFQMCRKTLLPALLAYTAAGKRKVGAWCLEQGAIEVDFQDSAAFSNLNSRKDFSKLA